MGQITVVGTVLIHPPTQGQAPPIVGIPLPAGTQAGDFIVVAADTNSTVTMSDARMTEVIGLSNAGLWYGTADGSGDPIGLTLDFGTEFKYAAATLAVLRGVRVQSMTSHSFSGAGTTLPASGFGQIVAAFADYNVVDGAMVTPVGWTNLVRAPSGKAHAHIFMIEESTAADTTYESAGNTASFGGVAIFRIPVRLYAPPCRLFPREDGLGVGSGRHFPPPKSQQRSSRRFGYY